MLNRRVWVLLVVIIIIIGIICGIIASTAQKTNAEIEENRKNKISNVQIEDAIDAIVGENTQNEIENKDVAQNDIKNTTTETFVEDQKTDEEKAIEIVKNDYKKSNDIKYNVEGIDENGRQIVVVRDSKTTEALAFYFVNIADQTFTKKEMN